MRKRRNRIDWDVDREERRQETRRNFMKTTATMGLGGAAIITVVSRGLDHPNAPPAENGAVSSLQQEKEKLESTLASIYASGQFGSDAFVQNCRRQSPEMLPLLHRYNELRSGKPADFLPEEEVRLLRRMVEISGRAPQTGLPLPPSPELSRQR